MSVQSISYAANYSILVLNKDQQLAGHCSAKRSIELVDQVITGLNCCDLKAVDSHCNNCFSAASALTLPHSSLIATHYSQSISKDHFVVNYLCPILKRLKPPPI